MSNNMIFDTKNHISLIATDKDDLLKLLSAFRVSSCDLSIRGVIKLTKEEFNEICNHLHQIAKICKITKE